MKEGEEVEEVRRERIKIEGGEIDIVLLRDEDPNGEYFLIEVDGVRWLYSDSKIHAIVLFEMMKEHLREYVGYKKRP